MDLKISCIRNSDCQEDQFEYCNSKTSHCEIIEKSCPFDCSSRGECVSVSLYNTSYRLINCSIFDLDCVVKCECVDGYLGSACEKIEGEFKTDQDTRHMLSETLSSLMKQDNPSREVVLSWMNSLSSISMNMDVLHDETKCLLIEIGVDIMKIIRDVPTISMTERQRESATERERESATERESQQDRELERKVMLTLHHEQERDPDSQPYREIGRNISTLHRHEFLCIR
jgi:hypothetical protein